jgi:hypothetical protein
LLEATSHRSSLKLLPELSVVSSDSGVSRHPFAFRLPPSIVTCGEHTEDALKFAAGKPIRLISGETLLEMIRSVQGSRKCGGRSGQALAAFADLCEAGLTIGEL